ncbi:uncharacterized protein AB675_411 [Cyphellophora attinorum]|uniref:Uncharacterized protein n=1 Tax=Cyphellophora attinorum TaxID=1664694 RepID=A0A0N0NSB4_9EURO|nr:uncharacterized protein AB675_411 [Phialophora attinorum]KPI45809.1 hypothetical protein AB675_411 [Phialophora attinorum]
MSPPTFLILEVRAAFRCSARQHAATRLRPYSTTTSLLARLPPHKSTSKPSPRTKLSTPAQLVSPAKQPHRDDAFSSGSSEGTSTSTDLMPADPRRTSLDTGSAVTIPTKVLPKAEIAPGVKLSPMQRLHIEHLTRHPPQPKAERVFKNHLLIYNLPRATVGFMIFSRVVSIGVFLFFTAVWIPAYYLDITSETSTSQVPLYTLPLIWVISAVPVFMLNHLTRSIVTEIFLNLSEKARRSPTAAMTYARNLPKDASLQLRFLRWTGIPGSMEVKLAEIRPAGAAAAAPATSGSVLGASRPSATSATRTLTSKLPNPTASSTGRTNWITNLRNAFSRPVNFTIPMTPRLKSESSIWKPSLTEFFVRPKTAAGRAARDTIPGLWEVVYKRLTGIEVSAVGRWRS